METIEYKGLAIEIYQDDSPENPIKEWDMLGKYCCWHKEYDLGNCDNFETPDDLEVYAKKNKALLYPLYMYDHSGIGLSLTNDRYPFNCPWDAGQLGYILVERKDALALLSAKKITDKVKEKVWEVINGEIDTYNQYLSGDVYYFVIKKDGGDGLDSCGGYYGIESAFDAAKQEVDYYIEHKDVATQSKE